MRTFIDNLLKSKTLQWILISITLIFAFARFVNINADFPSGITTSGELYTDEGWYTDGAVRYLLTGSWYLEGDHNNTAISMPVGQILHFLSFSLFGLSIASARITVIITFLLMTVLEALLIRKTFGNLAAIFSALLLSTNYFAFVYSRLALVYLTASFFVVASLFLVGGINNKSKYTKTLLASFMLVLGILTSTTAAVAIPLLLFLVWQSESNIKTRVLLVLISGLILMIFVGGYFIIVRKLFPVDYAFFKWASTGSFFTSFSAWRWNLTHKIFPRLKYLGSGIIEITAIFTLLALIFSKTFRKKPLAWLLIGYTGFCIGMLSINSYNPPRYYLLLLGPVIGLCSVSCTSLVELLNEKKKPILALVPLLSIILLSVSGSREIIAYLMSPQYSFYEMSHSIEDILQEREGTVRGVLLFGDISDSVSLEIGTNAANSLLYTSETVIPRLMKYCPEYIIVHTSDLDSVVRKLGGVVTELGAWDVFDNYYANGEQVRLYEVTWPQLGSN